LQHARGRDQSGLGLQVWRGFASSNKNLAISQREIDQAASDQETRRQSAGGVASKRRLPQLFSLCLNVPSLFGLDGNVKQLIIAGSAQFKLMLSGYPKGADSFNNYVSL
jgi:hypothetical protein